MVIQDQIDTTDSAGENYFVSMTDMMVGLLFVFIIMLMAFALSYRQREDVSQDDINKLRKAVEVVDHKIDDLKKVYQKRAQFLEDIKNRLIDVGVVQVKVDPATGVLRLGEGVLFDPESASIRQPEGPANIRKIGLVLVDVLPCYLGTISNRQFSSCSGSTAEVTLESIFLEGHADSSGQISKNWSLSVNRAIATYRELEHQAPQLTSFINSAGERLFSVSGYGQYRPVDTNDNAAGRAANRRIDLRFNMQLDQGRALDQIRTELRRVLDR
jgi:flagellar motor protein MotB